METSGDVNVPSFLDVRVNHGYGPRPIPNDRDREITGFIERVREAPEIDRARLVESLGTAHAPVLRAFAERMASFAVRQGAVEPLVNALHALGLAAAAGDDVRELILVLPLIDRSAELIGRDARDVFDYALAAVPESDQRDAIASFPDREPEDRSLEAFGYVEGRDADGFRYIRTW